MANSFRAVVGEAESAVSASQLARRLVALGLGALFSPARAGRAPSARCPAAGSRLA